MSFGFSVGDFIAAIQLANKIRKEFAHAPDQFEAVSKELRSLSIILQDADVNFPKQDLSIDQKRNLEDIDRGCRDVFDELERILAENSELKSENGSIGKRFKRGWKRFKWESEDINELRGRISTNIGLLNAFHGQLTRDNVAKLVRHQEDQEFQSILKWITPLDYVAQHQDFITRRQEGTGRWLLDSAEFQLWLETDKQTLFCPGIPGAGKTIITSIVIEELATRFDNNRGVGIAYLYFNFRHQDEQKPEDMIASLLKQLIQGISSLPQNVRTLYDQHNKIKKPTRPSLDEILSTLHSVVTAYSKVFIIIDALDECLSSNGCRSKFLSGIFNLQSKVGVKLFATSRPNLDIEQEFKGCLSHDIIARDEDIRRYLDNQMSQLPSCVRNRVELQEEIKTEISKAVEGMFLLAQLYLQSLKDKTSARAIKNTLRGFRRQIQSSSEDKKLDILSAAYTDAMDRINEQQTGFRLLAHQVLSWITYAQRPLTTRELQIAIAVEEGDSELDGDGLPEIEDMVSVCAGLATIDIESGIIRLVHYTAQEYFDSAKERFFLDSEANITSACVTYLSFNIFKSGSCRTEQEFEERCALNEFFLYAALSWGHHARKAFPLSQTLKQLVSEYLSCQALVDASSEALGFVEEYPSVFNNDEERPGNITGLHLAAYFGINEILDFIIENGTEVDSKDKYGQTPLSWAAKYGHEAAVKVLLDKGAKSNSKSIRGETPLMYPIFRGYEPVVKLLLENGAEADVQDVNGLTPLFWTAERGYEVLAKLLLDNGAEVDTKDEDGLTPLSRAAEIGHVAFTKLLLERGAEVDSKDSKYGETPLLQATKNGHRAVVKLLLESGANPELGDSVKRTPLWWAARKGNIVLQTLLLTGRVNINAEDHYHSTPLSVAARMGHTNVVNLLLSQDCSLIIKDSCNRSALWWARRTEHSDIATILLKKYKENGIVLTEDGVSTTKSLIFDDPMLRSCDVCMFGIPREDRFYHCNICHKGDFDICKECFAMKAHCLDKSHTLVKE